MSGFLSLLLQVIHIVSAHLSYYWGPKVSGRLIFKEEQERTVPLSLSLSISPGVTNPHTLYDLPIVLNPFCLYKF